MSKFSDDGRLKLPGGQMVSAEYVDRLSRIVLSFCGGVRRLLARDQSLNQKLEDLSRVIEKTLDAKDISGLGKEIQEYFDYKKVEENFRVLEREGLVGMVRELSLTLKELTEPTGTFDKDLDHLIDEIQKTDNLLDLRAIKDKIIQNTRQVQGQIKSLRQELEQAQKQMVTLQSQLEETEARVIIDSLTRILNRSAYDLRIPQVVKEHRRFKETSTLAVVDIDKFKEINDNHGHQCGDNALVSIAQTIKECIRESDVVFRYGGEEFVILFYKTPLQGAQVIAEKIRERVASVRTHLVNDFYADKSKRVQVTVSLGLSELRPEDTPEAWFERADQALYRAKELGRNRVVTAPAS